MIGILVHVNGAPLELINIQNIESLDNDIQGGKHLYTVSYTGGRQFQITHNRRDGWNKLLVAVLKRMEKSGEAA